MIHGAQNIGPRRATRLDPAGPAAASLGGLRAAPLGMRGEILRRHSGDAGGKGSRLVYTSADGAFSPDTPEQRMQRAGFTSCEEVAFDALWRKFLPGEPHENAWFLRIGTASV